MNRVGSVILVIAGLTSIAVQGAELIGRSAPRKLAANDAVLRLVEGAQLHVTADVLDQLVRKPIDQHVPVNDVLLGVPLTGRAHLTGNTKLKLVEDAERGVFDIFLTGTAISSTVGDAGQAKIHSRTVTNFVARKRIILDDQGLRSLPAACNARAASTVTDATSPLPGVRGRLARRIGQQRTQESLAEADRISARHTEERLCRQFDAEVAVQLADANQLLQSQIRALAKGRAQPALQFRTTAHRLCVSGGHAEAPTIRGPAAMEDPAQKVAAVIIIPASAIDLATAAGFLGFFAGGASPRTLADLAQQVLPAEMVQSLGEQNVLDGAEYGIRFAVDRGQFVLALHGRND